MRAAITKIPHLLDEEVLLKIPRFMNDFIYMYDLFTMSVMGMGEKPRNGLLTNGCITLFIKFYLV